LNGYVLDARIGPIQKSPGPAQGKRSPSALALEADSHVPMGYKPGRGMAQLHIQASESCLAPGEEPFYLYDRGYQGAEFVSWHMGRGDMFLMRCKNSFNSEIAALPDTGPANYSVGIGGHALRAIKLRLPSGEWETLLTNLADIRMGIKAFKKLYFMR